MKKSRRLQVLWIIIGLILINAICSHWCHNYLFDKRQEEFKGHAALMAKYEQEFKKAVNAREISRMAMIFERLAVYVNKRDSSEQALHKDEYGMMVFGTWSLAILGLAIIPILCRCRRKDFKLKVDSA